MNEETTLARIVINPKVMGGKPIIKGTRLTVQYILKRLADGETVEELENEHEGLTKDDIHACFLFAANAVDTITFLPAVEAGGRQVHSPG